VIDAASEFGRALPLMMTAAGTISAARVLILGAGVAGLQAIATARRLGAIVSAYDVRAASKEQVESLGATFVSVEAKETGEGTGGYAKEMSDDYKKAQEEKLKEEARIAEEEKKRQEEEKKRLEEYEQTQKYWEDNRYKFIVNFDDSDDEGEESEVDEKEEKKEEMDELSDKLENTSIVDDELVHKTVISQIIHPKNEKNIKKYIMSYMELPNEGDNIKYADKTKKPVTLNLTNLEIDRLMFIMKYLDYEQK